VRLPSRYVTPAADRFLAMLRQAAGRLEASWATSAR